MKSQNSLRSHLSKLSAENFPQMLNFTLDTSMSKVSKPAELKLLFKSLIEILKYLSQKQSVLFILDDLEFLHRECLEAMGDLGHQVNFFSFSGFEIIILYKNDYYFSQIIFDIWIISFLCWAKVYL